VILPEDQRREMREVESRGSTRGRSRARRSGGKGPWWRPGARRAVAGAGSVSRRGDVDRLDRGDRALLRGGDPLLKVPHLGGQRRLVADRRGMRPRRATLRARLGEPEDVVDEEEDVLPSSSRKYSAAVRADSPTRSRAPGGSFIWPYTRHAFSRTFDSFISSQRSFLAVRSPTPPNTE